ncbi:MAG: tRNA (N(6)-L-threonylcarbamoyladenosine(37)-C(2))-methylthiotransferase MtaB [Myxococcota bacterium]
MGGRYRIHTLGCKANGYDSDLLQAELGRRGWQPAAPDEEPDLVVVNSCTVTDEADRQSRKSVRRLARRHPEARVVVTGCGAEVAPDRYAATRGVDAVVGNQDKPRLMDLLTEGDADGTILGDVAPYPERKKPRHDPERAWPEPERSFLAPEAVEGRTRVFLKVQEGCDAFCTFCIIPYARGPARSLRPVELVRQVRSVVERGAQEVVLTGTALGDFGHDLGDFGHDLGDGVGFEDLVEMLLRETDLPRLRVSSLDPRETSPRLRGLMEREPRLCPHVHLSLQSPHPRVLKRMKRRYTADTVVETLQALDDMGRRLARARDLVGGVFVGMDVIAGFPGETDDAFRWTLERLEDLPWHRLHVFPYSEREGTAATRLDEEVPREERKRRVKALMALSTERLAARYGGVLEAGRPLRILVEGPTRAPGDRPLPPGARAWVAGHTDNYYRVAVPVADPDAVANRFVTVEPEALHLRERSGDAVLVGRPTAAGDAEEAA